jgi:hypothetical protein
MLGCAHLGTRGCGAWAGQRRGPSRPAAEIFFGEAAGWAHPRQGKPAWAMTLLVAIATSIPARLAAHVPVVDVLRYE